LVGLVAALRTRGTAARWIAATALLECAGVVLIIISARYRLTAAAPLLALAGLGAKIVVDALRARDSKLTAALATGFAIASVIVWPVRVRDTRSLAWRELGEAWAAVGDTSSAVGAFQEAVNCAPGEPEILEALADATERSGNGERARTYWLRLERLQHRRGDAEAAAAAQSRARRLSSQRFDEEGP
jgi:Flp pilus assembly protein TadD